MADAGHIDRRRFLRLAAAAGGALLPALARGQMNMGGMPMGQSTPAAPAPSTATPPSPADWTVRIAPGLIDLAPDRVISTTLYNNQFPGPLMRFKEGQTVTIDIHNDTDRPEQLHWHGQFLPPDVDGAAEEGTPFIPPHGMRRINLTPGPAGFRFYHSHIMGRGDLNVGLYTGQVGPVYIEPKENRGDYDQEIFLVLKEFQPALTTLGDMDMDILSPSDQVKELVEQARAAKTPAANMNGMKMPMGYEVVYSQFSINGKSLGQGDPIKVKRGQRILFHVLNASATEIRSLALPGHVFKVVALDGNPVPTPAVVPFLWIGTAERVSAVVEMNRPGVWVMGDISDHERTSGMGIVIAYAGQSGKPRWAAPAPARWDYTRFGAKDATPLSRQPDELIETTFALKPAADHGFNLWTINGIPFSMEKMEPLFKLRHGRRYRWRMRNASDDTHPLHLHRHSFELTRYAGKTTSGLLKDVIMIGPCQEVEVDFTADQPGLSLFHCHMQIHMDFGFMGLFQCD